MSERDVSIIDVGSTKEDETDLYKDIDEEAALKSLKENSIHGLLESRLTELLKEGSLVEDKDKRDIFVKDSVN